jgi:esterase/lipase
MKHIYCISGFGADERVFANLNFGENQVHFIPWKIPQRNETLKNYTHRMAEDIHHSNPVVTGLSFGGMISIEMAKIMSFEKIIMISSIKTFHEKPLYMQFAATIHLNKLIPMRPYPILERLENYNLGVQSKDEKKLVNEYRKNINPLYSEWAIEQILNWKNDWIPKNLIHLHGGNDHIFPVKNIKADFVIQGGGHLMLLNKAVEVNEILKRII